MIRVGDHVEQRDSVGHHGKTGEVLSIDGDMLHIKWEDGHESAFIPGPGSLAVLTHGSGTKAKSSRRRQSS